MKNNLYNSVTDKSAIKEYGATQDLAARKSCPPYIFHSHSAALTYTLKQGDGQRLNKYGILKVYNINQSIEIPVTKLLGKWKERYVGVTVAISDGEWRVDKEESESVVNEINQDSALKIFFEKVKKYALKFKPLKMPEFMEQRNG